MHIRWSRCPHCGKTVDVGSYGGGPIDSKLGPPIISTCPRCGRQFSDGSREWEDMGWLGKSRELFLAAVGGLLLAPLLGGVAGFFLSRLWSVEGSVGFAASAAFITSIAYFCGFGRMIRQSRERTSAGSGEQEPERVAVGSVESGEQHAPPPNLTALLAPLGRTQGLYDAVRLGGWNLSIRIRALVDRGSDSESLPGSVVSACLAYTAVIMSLVQLIRDSAWYESHEHTVVYGQVSYLMEVVLSDGEVKWKRYEKLNKEGLQKAQKSLGSRQWSAKATSDLRDMDAAFIEYLENFGKAPTPEHSMIVVFLKQASVSEHARPAVVPLLLDFIKEMRKEFSKLP